MSRLAYPWISWDKNNANTSCLAPDYCIHPGRAGPWNPFPVLHDAFEASGCQSICLQRQVVVGNFVDDVVSTVATEPDFTEDGFYNDFFKMLGYFYGDIVGLEGASGLRLDQPCRRRVSKGDESTRLRRRRRHQPLLRQQPGRMVPR